MIAEVYGHTMRLDPEDTVLTPCLAGGNTFERMTVAALPRLVKAGDTVVDAGANIGYYTLLLARLVGPAGRVYAFEPDPRAFALLRRNVEENGYENVVLSPRAVGRATGRGRLWLNGSNRGDNRMSPVEGWPSVEAEVVALDDAVPGPAAFLKLDVQGWEAEALAGASRLLSDPVVSVACELWREGLTAAGTGTRELLALFAGFRLWFPDEELLAVRAASPEELAALAEGDAVNFIATRGQPLDGVAMPRFRFVHGLGDCANAACLLDACRRLGHDVAIQCTPDKAIVFRAAGCEIVGDAPEAHPWAHPPDPAQPGPPGPWNGNKTAWNVSRYGLPDIGSAAQRWAAMGEARPSLGRFVTDEVRGRVGAYLATLPRPVVLLHTKGNTGTESKDYPEALTVELYRQLLDRMDGCLLLLDWDHRVPRLAHGRARHLADDWRTLDLLELHETMRQSDLLLGIDSGVLHFSRFAGTPAVGIWTRNHPSAFALPRRDAVHLVGRRHQALNRSRRLAFHIVESAADPPSPADIADTAAFMLGERDLLAHPGPDAVLRGLLADAREGGHGDYRDRHRTLAAFLRLLKGKASPLVADLAGAARATESLGFFLKHHGGELHAVGPGHAAPAPEDGLPVSCHRIDGLSWLRAQENKLIDGLCLGGSEAACLEEARAALPKLSPGAPILVDASPWRVGGYRGAGAQAVPWLLSQGWRVRLAGWQVLLER